MASTDPSKTETGSNPQSVELSHENNALTAGDENALDDQELAAYLSLESKQQEKQHPEEAQESVESKTARITSSCEPDTSTADITSDKRPLDPNEEDLETKNTLDSEKQQYNMDESTEDESSNASRSRCSSADSTPIKHSEPPTPTPANQKTPKSARSSDRRSGRSSRFPNRQGIVWRVGAKLEAKDFQEKWYTAKILEVDSTDNTIMIHFEGWNSRYDDWFPMTSERLRCITRHSERKETRSKTSNKSEHKIGECVFAKWTDCRMYPGKIVGVSSSGSYEILFYDGFKKNVVPINVKTMPDEVQQEYAKAGLLPEVGRKNRFPIKDLAKEIQDRRDYKVRSPESTRRQRKDSERKSMDKDKRDRSKEKEPRKEKEEWEVKSITTSNTVPEKRKRSTDAWQPLMKKQREDSTKPERRDSRRESGGKEEKIKREVGRPKKTETKSSPQDNTAVGTKQKVSGASKKPPVLPPISIDVDTDLDAETSSGRKSEKTTPKTTPKTPLSSPMDTLTTELPTEEYLCPFSSCTKTFRKKSLVEYHVKYYHTEDGSPVQPPPPRGKRKKTLSVCSDDSELSLGGQKSKAKKKPRASLESTVSSLPEVVCNEDAMSEDTKTTTTEEYQQSLTQNDCEDPLLDEEDDQAIDRIEKDEVVNCICQINEENGLMIQCDVCLCWQHALCMEITEETLPAKYVCYVCINPPGVRESGRFIYDQDWIKMGTMQRFSFLPEDRHTAKKARIMEATHSLVGDMINVKQVLHSTKRELSVLNKENSAELCIWKNQLDPSVISETKTVESDLSSKDIKEEINENTANSDKNLANSSGDSQNTTSETDTVSNSMEQSVTLKENIKTENSNSSSPTNLEEIKIKHESDEVNVDNICENGIQEKEVEGDKESSEDKVVKVEVKEENPFENCPIHLLEHVSQVHDNVDLRLDLLEEQIAALESAEDGKNVDILKDVPKVKKSIHQLINDLAKVKRMSMYH